MIMHRPPCYAYTVLLSLSYPPPRRLVPSPPVRLEQQSPRTLRARSVTHPLIRTDNRFWQAHSLRSLARSFARSPRIVSPVSPRGRKSLDSSSIVPRNSQPSPPPVLSPRTAFPRIYRPIVPPRLYGKRAPLERKKRKREKAAAPCVSRSLVSTATDFPSLLRSPSVSFFSKGSILAYRLCVTSYRLSGLGRGAARVCVYVCVRACVCEKSHTPRGYWNR